MTERVKDGGPAFPSEQSHTQEGWNQTYDPGMTLRDWFAGQAIAGLLAAFAHPNSMGPAEASPEQHAEHAFGIADAMLRAREKGNDHE